MKDLKIILIVTTIVVLGVATVGLALASSYNNSSYYGGMMGYSTPYQDEDWWTEMQEHMEDHWNEVQDEEWFVEMRTYMNEHLDDVENQDWFDEMTEYMEEQRFGNNYRYGGFGCH